MKKIIFAVLLGSSLYGITLHNALSLINTHALQLHILHHNLSVQKQNIKKAKRLFPNNPIFKTSFSRIDFSPNAYNFKISQKINIASQSHYKTLMAQNDYKVASLSLKKTKVTLAVKIRTIFLKAWLDKQNIAIIDKILIYEQRLSQQIKDKIDSDALLHGSDSVVLVFLSQYNNEKTQYLLDLHVQKIQLSNILNQHISSVNTTFKKDFTNVTLVDLNQQINQNYRVLMTTHRLDKIKAKMQMLQRSRYLSYVKLGFNYGLNANNIINARSETITLSFPIPIANRHQYSIVALMNKISVLEYKKELVKNRIRANVQIYFSNLEASIKMTSIYKRHILKKLKSYLDVTRQRYSHGLIALEVMQSAFMNYTTTEQKYQKERYDILLDKLHISQELDHV